MKRIIISLVLSALIACGCVFEFGYIGGRAEEYLRRVENIENLLKNGENRQAEIECRAAESGWDRESKMIYTMLNHDFADAVGGSLSKMLAHIENGSTSLALAESAGAKKGLASMKGSEYPFFENIL